MLGHATRLTILLSLADGERSVSQIADATGLVQPALSQQLALLRKAALVSTRREAKQIFYALDPAAIAQVRGLLDRIVCGQARLDGIAVGMPSRNDDAALLGAAVFAKFGGSAT